MGAQINEHQLEEILKYVEIGVKEGATLITGGQRLTENGLDGAFLAPTLLANGTNTMCVAQEEIFGPVATVIKFETEEEVIRLANDSEYGLGGAFFKISKWHYGLLSWCTDRSDVGQHIQSIARGRAIWRL